MFVIKAGVQVPFACVKHTSPAGLHEISYQGVKVLSCLIAWNKDSDTYRVSVLIWKVCVFGKMSLKSLASDRTESLFWG